MGHSHTWIVVSHLDAFRRPAPGDADSRATYVGSISTVSEQDTRAADSDDASAIVPDAVIPVDIGI